MWSVRKEWCVHSLQCTRFFPAVVCSWCDSEWHPLSSHRASAATSPAQSVTTLMSRTQLRSTWRRSCRKWFARNMMQLLWSWRWDLAQCPLLQTRSVPLPKSLIGALCYACLADQAVPGRGAWQDKRPDVQRMTGDWQASLGPFPS